jgi:tetratricopeptide (TPR) repeat protein
VVSRAAEPVAPSTTTRTPSFINAAAMPKIYTDDELQAALRAKLTHDELRLVVNPLASSPQMKRWAQALTQDAKGDVDKAKKIFDGLTQRAQFNRVDTTRTAQEVFSAWDNPQESFNCQEFSKLFVAMAREVGVKAFYVYVEKDHKGNEVVHACAGVFADGKALLVDVLNRWFGAPHRGFAFLDDLQTIAFQLNQSEEVTRCRMAAKLHPDSALTQFNLSLALMGAQQWEEARRVLTIALRLESNGCKAHYAQGLMAFHDGETERAMGHFRKASEFMPEDAHVHFFLASALHAQGKLKEARDAYRASLRYQPRDYIAERARRAIVQINAQVGTD